MDVTYAIIKVYVTERNDDIKRHSNDFTYAIIKVYVTERNDDIKRHSNDFTIWRTSAIEVTALLKIYV